MRSTPILPPNKAKSCRKATTYGDRPLDQLTMSSRSKTSTITRLSTKIAFCKTLDQRIIIQSTFQKEELKLLTLEELELSKPMTKNRLKSMGLLVISAGNHQAILAKPKCSRLAHNTGEVFISNLPIMLEEIV